MKSLVFLDAYSKTTLTFVLKKKGVKRANLPHFDFIEAKEYDVDKGRCIVEASFQLTLTNSNSWSP